MRHRTGLGNVAWSAIALAAIGSMGGCGSHRAVCGDGVYEEGAEGCDDGNTHAGDGCDARCTVERGYTCADGMACDPVCGDGIRADAEVCDPSASSDAGYCSMDCTTLTGRCGDTIVQAQQEACDDGNTVASDGCNRCDASLGFTCQASTNTCDASPVDPARVIADMSPAELTQFCTWFIATLGGPGHVHHCGSVDFTVYSVAMCQSGVMTYPSNVSRCTVGDFEAWTAERVDACDLLTDDSALCS